MVNSIPANQGMPHDSATFTLTLVLVSFWSLIDHSPFHRQYNTAKTPGNITKTYPVWNKAASRPQISNLGMNPRLDERVAQLN